MSGRTGGASDSCRTKCSFRESMTRARGEKGFGESAWRGRRTPTLAVPAADTTHGVAVNAASADRGGTMVRPSLREDGSRPQNALSPGEINGAALTAPASDATAPVRVGPGDGAPLRRLPRRRNPPSGADRASILGDAVPAVPLWPRVSVVIPTMNEALNLPHVLATLPTNLFEVILVDGHSTDGTVDVARRLRPDVCVVAQTGRGKGNALLCGFQACRGDVIVMFDADGSADPAEIPFFVAALTAGADFAKGSRRAVGGGSADFTFGRRLGNRLLSLMVNRLYGTRYTDLCYGYNAFWARCLPAMSIDCDGFEVETLINIRVARAGLRITEVPSFERERLHGESKLRITRDGIRILRTIVRERVRDR